MAADGMLRPGHFPARLAGENCSAVVTADPGTGTFGWLSLAMRRGRALSHGAVAKGTVLPRCCSQPQDKGTGLASSWGRRSGSPCPHWSVPQLLSPAPQDEGLGGQAGEHAVWQGADSDASLQCTTTRVTSGSSCAETASAFPSTSSATMTMTAVMARTSPQSVVGVCRTREDSEGSISCSTVPDSHAESPGL